MALRDYTDADVENFMRQGYDVVPFPNATRDTNWHEFAEKALDLLNRVAAKMDNIVDQAREFRLVV